MTVWVGNSWLPTGVGSFAAITVGHTVFWDGNYSGTAAVALMSHEYVHVLQIENGGLANIASYGWNAIGQAIGRQEASGPGNRNEAIGYLWEGWVNAFREYGAKPAWCTFQPTSGGVDEC
jgi:hypothetical protein